MSMGDMYLREAKDEDCELLFVWANDSDTRKNSFHTEIIEYDSHKEWFGRLLNSENRYQYILMNGISPVGQVRIEIRDAEAIISYSIAPEHRGKGYGKRIICMITEKVIANNLDVIRIVAYVKSDNVASIRCFESAGFVYKNERYEYEIHGERGNKE